MYTHDVDRRWYKMYSNRVFNDNDYDDECKTRNFITTTNYNMQARLPAAVPGVAADLSRPNDVDATHAPRSQTLWWHETEHTRARYRFVPTKIKRKKWDYAIILNYCTARFIVTVSLSSQNIVNNCNTPWRYYGSPRGDVLESWSCGCRRLISLRALFFMRATIWTDSSTVYEPMCRTHKKCARTVPEMFYGLKWKKKKLYYTINYFAGKLY